jgi:hypothetical protein
VLDRGLAMRQFVGAELLDRLGERRVGVAEAFGLGAVMLVDDLLDRDGAGHRGARPQERGCGAQGVAGDMPQRLQQGRAHMARAHQFVEGGEVALFLPGHPADFVARPAAPDHRQLAVIDPHRAVFAGVVDPDHRFDVGLRHRVAGQIGRALGNHAVAVACDTGRRVRAKTTAHTPAMPSEARRFQPASDTPNKDHCTRSHSTGAVPIIWRFISSSVTAPPPPLAVQALGPANHFCSTPT